MDVMTIGHGIDMTVVMKLDCMVQECEWRTSTRTGVAGQLECVAPVYLTMAATTGKCRYESV